MKLYKALKLRKSLIGEISKLKTQINQKNSYIEGSKNGQKFNVKEVYSELLSKIEELISLKFAINEANREIQGQIYMLSEYKALISFWNDVSVVEGTEMVRYSEKIQNYVVQVDETERNAIVESFQKKVDAIQEELDEYNFNTEIPWGDVSEEEMKILDLDLKESRKNNNGLTCGCNSNRCSGHNEKEDTTDIKE